MACYVRFPIVGRPHEYLLTWTTTPWTLPANQAIAINEHLEYVRVHLRTGQTYIVQRGRLAEVLKEVDLTGSSLAAMALAQSGPETVPIDAVASVGVDELLRLQYEHPWCQGTLLSVVAAAFVTADTGSGLVHLAPAYGVDDYMVAKAAGIQPREIGIHRGRSVPPVHD